MQLAGQDKEVQKQLKQPGKQRACLWGPVVLDMDREEVVAWMVLSGMLDRVPMS